MGLSAPSAALVRHACICFAITIVALWTLYLIRGPLLLFYVCILFATGLSPLVRWIERRRPVLSTAQAVPVLYRQSAD